MGKQRHKSFQSQPIAKASRGRLITEIVLIYFVILAGIICLASRYDVPMLSSGRPTLWLRLQEFIYYILPVILAVMVGIVFRPFWINSRNVIVSIFAVHIFLSFGVFVCRYVYVAQRSRAISQAENATLKILSFSHKFHDSDGDGSIDTITFHGFFDMSEFPEGTYRLVAAIVREDPSQGRYPLGAFSVALKSRQKGRQFKGNYKLDLHSCPEEFKAGTFSLDLMLEGEFPLDDKGKGILAVSRWIPFFRNTDWNGIDPDLSDTAILLGQFPQVSTFEILPLSF